MGGQGEERVSICPPHLLSRVPSSSSLFQNGIFPVGPVLTPGWDNMGPLSGPGSFLGRGEEQIRVQPAIPGHGALAEPHVLEGTRPLPCEVSLRPDMPSGGLCGPCFALGWRALLSSLSPGTPHLWPWLLSCTSGAHSVGRRRGGANGR